MDDEWLAVDVFRLEIAAVLSPVNNGKRRDKEKHILLLFFCWELFHIRTKLFSIQMLTAMPSVRFDMSSRSHLHFLLRRWKLWVEILHTQIKSEILKCCFLRDLRVFKAEKKILWII